MDRIAIRRLHAIPLARGAGLGDKQKIIALSELAALGYRVTNPQALDAAAPESIAAFGTLISELREMRGGHVAYVPLFLDFPNEVPDDDAYFVKRILGAFLNEVSYPEGHKLESGAIVPTWLFDLERFGADPIHQLQSKSLWEAAAESLTKRAPDKKTQWQNLTVLLGEETDVKLREWLRSCVYAKSSIREAWRDDIRSLLDRYGVDHLDTENISFKENYALVLRALWQTRRYSAVRAMAKTPTDVLRLMAALTDGDASLGKPIRFPKLRRAERRVVMQILEAAPSLHEDLRRYRGLWLALGRSIHVGEYAKAYPKTAAAFAALRNGSIRTFATRTEALIQAGEVEPLLTHLGDRPGQLMRKLHEIARRFPTATTAISDAFAAVANKMTVKNLLVLRSYFATINTAERRTIINKRGTIKVLPNITKGALTAQQLALLLATIEDALTSNLGARESFNGKSVFIDPRLASYTVPLQQRAASDGLLCVGRGSRIPLTACHVLRLFIYWKQNSQPTDLDLSVIHFDDAWNYGGHVSYTELKGDGIVHSGDIQSAPQGAAEFIDMQLDALPPSARYIAAQVYRYAGESFNQMTSHAGWMVREKVDANYATFDIRTVANKFNLSGQAGFCQPLVFDRKTNEIIITDLYMGNSPVFNRVEGEVHNIAIASREIAQFTETRPTLHDLAHFHASARGGVITSNAEADIRFGFDGRTYDMLNASKLLSELL